MLNSQEEINEIEVVGAEVVSTCDALRLCDPEEFFEMIEQCKICGRCI